ncbi:PAS domain S-box/diguanylate cyclase (GGDEF) domain-containing protein [Leptospira ellinghausenii]|uniref:PAS domain S-box/diguanylate cyclase (GGDEF) domain-containing protein n=1 Tax=Leptospira ellinghausenii TaxID=1917822 RepID=A0A2P2DIR7_9LEPT|nr:PAS domain S-box/diguanylate cyclase (GGDEF) domain-containing protein [Leptospira ellinghausenii]
MNGNRISMKGRSNRADDFDFVLRDIAQNMNRSIELLNSIYEIGKQKLRNLDKARL